MESTEVLHEVNNTWNMPDEIGPFSCTRVQTGDTFLLSFISSQKNHLCVCVMYHPVYLYVYMWQVSVYLSLCMFVRLDRAQSANE